MYSWSSWNDGNWADWSPWTSNPNSRYPKVTMQNGQINIGGQQFNPDQNNQMQSTRERVYPTRRVTQPTQRPTTRPTTPPPRPIYTRPRTTTRRPTTRRTTTRRVTRPEVRPEVRPSRPIETITVPPLNPKIIGNQDQVTYRECLEPGDQMGTGQIFFGTHDDLILRVQPDSAHHPRTRCYHYLLDQLDQHILTFTCASVALLTSCLLIKYNSRCVKYKVIYLIMDELFSNG